MAKSENASWLDILSAARDNFPAAEENESAVVSESNPDSVHTERLDISFEKKGRGGKTATIISGFTSFTQEQLLELASAMKQKLGTGGSARGNEILIQGDRRQDVLKYLTSNGYKARII